MLIINKDHYTFDDVLIRPTYSNIDSRATIKTNQYLFDFEMEIPIISANMDFVTGSRMANAMAFAGGLGILHRFCPWEAQLDNLSKLEFGPLTLSVGTRDINLSFKKITEVDSLFPAYKKRVVCIDVAHGHHSKVKELLERITKEHPNWYTIVGNIATYEAAVYFKYSEIQPDAIKVGIGPGSVCTTRVVTGVGVPQLSAIMDVADALRGTSIKLIADGGIKTSGDIVKALAAGADAVMLGKLLAGSQECPGSVIETGDGRRLRKYQGQSIFGVNQELYTKEGVAGYVEERGPVAQVLHQLVGGLKSGMSYVGASSLQELRERAVFIPVSGNALIENHPRINLGV